MKNEETIKQDVKEYYGETLQSTEDLKTSACCPIETMPADLKPLLANIHDEVISRFYGCGSPIPVALKGKRVLDLGCGTGRDVYTLSQLVGKEGHVYGVDMTENQLAVAEEFLPWHMDKFGFCCPNVSFHLGQIEDLASLGIEDNSLDLVVSNCVINLAADKKKVFAEILRVLKPGGELYFSDVFSGQRVPQELRDDATMIGECLGGAMYTEDFRRMMQSLGCLDVRAMSKAKISLDDAEIEAKAGMIDFYSMTMRTFKCDFEDICENYGQVAFYRGGIPEQPHRFRLDDHHLFEKGLPYPVCGNTAAMLAETRFAPYFEIIGDKNTHYGPFDCTSAPTGNADSGDMSTAGACC